MGRQRSSSTTPTTTTASASTSGTAAAGGHSVPIRLSLTHSLRSKCPRRAHSVVQGRPGHGLAIPHFQGGEVKWKWKKGSGRGDPRQNIVLQCNHVVTND